MPQEPPCCSHASPTNTLLTKLSLSALAVFLSSEGEVVGDKEVLKSLETHTQLEACECPVI